MLPKDDEDSASIVVLCCLLITIISIISGTFFIIFADPIGKILNTPEISSYIIFIPVIVFLNGLFIVRTYWLSRNKRYGLTATSQIINSISSKTVQIGIGIYSPSPLGLITGLVVGYITALAVLLQLIKDDLSLFRRVTMKHIRDLAIRYKRFPMFTSWSMVANSISTQITPLFLVFFFDPVIVGYYALANMVIFMPIGLIGSATSQVFFQKACDEKNRTGSVKNIVREIQQRLISIGMFPMFILIIIGTDLFSFVLGPQWYVAGEYAGILAPWLLFVFIASPLSTIFSVLEKQTIDLIFNLLILVSRIVVLVIGGLSGNPFFTLVLFSITGIIFWGWMNLYLLKISGIPYLIGLKDYIRFFCLGLVLIIPLLAVKLLIMPTYILFVVAGAVTVVYYTIILLNDSILKKEFLKIIRGFKI